MQLIAIYLWVDTDLYSDVSNTDPAASELVEQMLRGNADFPSCATIDTPFTPGGRRVVILRTPSTGIDALAILDAVNLHNASRPIALVPPPAPLDLASD